MTYQLNLFIGVAVILVSKLTSLLLKFTDEFLVCWLTGLICWGEVVSLLLPEAADVMETMATVAARLREEVRGEVTLRGLFDSIDVERKGFITKSSFGRKLQEYKIVLVSTSVDILFSVLVKGSAQEVVDVIPFEVFSALVFPETVELVGKPSKVDNTVVAVPEMKDDDTSRKLGVSVVGSGSNAMTSAGSSSSPSVSVQANSSASSAQAQSQVNQAPQFSDFFTYSFFVPTGAGVASAPP